MRFLVSVFLACPAIALAGWLGANNYDDCVLDSMKGVTSDLAARAILRSCRDKFPEKKPVDIDVPANVVNQLDGRAGMSDGFFKGSIYNGSRDWTITKITFALRAKNKDKSFIDMSSPKEYNADVTIRPLTNGDFIFSANSGDTNEYEWSITKARGYKSR